MWESRVFFAEFHISTASSTRGLTLPGTIRCWCGGQVADWKRGSPDHCR